MKALITGADGQVGRALAATVPQEVELIACNRAALDLAQPDAIADAVAQHRPDLILNAAAYTAVDRAESEADAAQAINATAVGVLAAAARDVGARLVHVSTDFVFDGRAGIAYAPDAPTNPIGAYGRTKLAGEQAAGDDALIVRTAWVYAAQGQNFVHTMLRLMRERPEIGVVADQIGTPTWAASLAAALWALAEQGARGIHHYTDAGVASWYDFAVAIQEEALSLSLLDRAIPIRPIATTDYPTPAARPAYSVLDKRATYAALGGPAPHWRANLRLMLKEVQAHG